MPSDFQKAPSRDTAVAKKKRKSILPTVLPPTVITASCFPKEELKLL